MFPLLSQRSCQRRAYCAEPGPLVDRLFDAANVRDDRRTAGETERTAATGVEDQVIVMKLQPQGTVQYVLR